MSRYLIDRKTRVALVMGQTVTLGDGETATLVGWRVPHKPGSTGRVTLRFEGQPGTTDGDADYFPSVIGAEWTD